MAESLDAVITYTIHVYDHMNSVLFYLDSTFSYVFVKLFYELGLDLNYEHLYAPMYVCTIVGAFVCVVQVYHVFSMIFMRFKTLEDLLILDMKEFDVFWE